jgi:hypothetical protein
MKKKRRQAALILAPALILVTTMSWRPAPAPIVSWAAATTAPSVTLGGDIITNASPAAADFDGDGDKEIVIGSRDGMLYVIGYDGASWSVIWSRQVADDFVAQGAPSTCENTAITEIQSSAAIADLDGDGRLDIVLTVGGNPSRHRNGGVLVYSFDGPWSFSMIPGWPQPRIDEIGAGEGIRYPDGCWDGFSSSAAVGDLDGDGDLEITTLALNRRIYAWHHDGVPVDGWPLHRNNDDLLLRGSESSPALGDIDDDGLVEVIVSTHSPPWDGSNPPYFPQATVWAINGDSSNVPNWPVIAENNVSSSPALGDIDGDGDLEVVLGSGRTIEEGMGNMVYAWHGDGSVVDGWPITTAGDMLASPALGDIDGDDDLEIVIGCGVPGNPAECTLLYAWHGNGAPVDGFPTIPPANDPNDNAPKGLPYPAVLADYDGDGAVEILIANWSAWGLSTVENDGTTNNDAALQTESSLFNSPLVDDVDDDGKLEVIMAGATAGHEAAIYVQDVNGDADPTIPWPMFMHDVHRTGNITFYDDDSPPQNPSASSPSHTLDAWSNDNQVHISLSGASDEQSGLAGYYYLWDTSPGTSVDESASWLTSEQDTFTTPLEDAAHWYLHVRAVNNARLLAEDTVHLGPFHIDTLPPLSQASAPPCAVLSATISWSGSDSGSGLSSYDVQVRQEGGPSWNTWQSATTATSGTYTGTTGPVYQFRSLASDLAGNTEIKSDDTYDTQTWLTQYSFGGTVYNVREQPVFMAQITATPPLPLDVYTDQQGKFFLCHQEALTYTLTASRSDYGALPATHGLSGTLSGLEFYLPPDDDALQSSGQFESGDWSGWGTAATATFTDSAHSGLQAVALGRAGGSLAWSANMSRSVALPNAQDLTLSLVHRAHGNDTLLLDGSTWVAVQVQGTAQAMTRPLTSTAAWSHTWLDLDAFRGQTVTLGLHLDSPAWGSGWLLVDELTPGTAVPGIRRVYLPLTLRLD